MNAFTSIHHVPSGWLQDSKLASFAPAYWQRLIDQRYTDETVRVYLCCLAHFARWMDRRRLAINSLNQETVRQFLDNHLSRCACPLPVQRSRHVMKAALRHLWTHLTESGVLKRQSTNAIEDELKRFNDFMKNAKGLADNTREQRLRILRSFLKEVPSCGSLAFGLIDAKDLRQFIGRKLERWSPASANVLAGTLRSYLRFRAFCGDDVKSLLPVIASPANWRLASLPKTLSSAEVISLLESFPSNLPSVHRAYAMVRCVVDLGLRTSEVIGIALDDIDWQTGTLRLIQNKSRRIDILPLPQTTGAAICKYLHSERPRTSNRKVFVRHVAPFDMPIRTGVVRRAVREAYHRCGLPHTRIHILRHTLAKRLLDSGGTLKDVADMLRHRNLDTSLIYAKVDSNRLSEVAMPWPGCAP